MYSRDKILVITVHIGLCCFGNKLRVNRVVTNALKKYTQYLCQVSSVKKWTGSILRFYWALCFQTKAIQYYQSSDHFFWLLFS